MLSQPCDSVGCTSKDGVGKRRYPVPTEHNEIGVDFVGIVKNQLMRWLTTPDLAMDLYSIGALSGYNRVHEAVNCMV